MRILIVEDEQVVLEDLAATLRNHGYEVAGKCESGREAIELVRKSPPDIILMDVKVQGDLNGVEAAIVIQAELDRSVPVIFLTAYNPKEFPYLNVVANCVHLSKPYTEGQLLESIKTVLNSNDGIGRN